MSKFKNAMFKDDMPNHYRWRGVNATVDLIRIMIKHFLIYILLTLPHIGQAQTNEVLRTYLENSLGYKTFTYKSSGKDARTTIYKVALKDCTLTYNIQHKTGNKIEGYTVRLLLSRISTVNLTKTDKGYYTITFTTNGNSIVKEYPDGRIIHQKSQFIPLADRNLKALEYLKKLQRDCQKD